MRYRTFAAIVAVLLPLTAPAKPEDAKILVPDLKARPPEFTIAKGTEITVEDYDAKTEFFLISLNDEPDVGPNYVSQENLRKAIAYNGDQSDFMKQRNQMIGSIYQTKLPMPLVREDVVLKAQQKTRAEAGAR